MIRRGRCRRSRNSPARRAWQGANLSRRRNKGYIGSMSDSTNALTDVIPSATPTEAEIAAWQALPRDEQVRRYRALFADPACQRITSDSMSDILAAAQQRAAERRG